MITIVGPTASGKTRLAVDVALEYGAEIISGDSRQVYRGMTLGTGKDLDDYIVRDSDGKVQKVVPCHLIDIREPGYKYSIYEFQQDFHTALSDIRQRGKEVVFCGGSGLYVESVLKGYEMHEVPENPELRQRLEGKTLDELTEILKTYKTLHNNTDTDTAKRAIREIEIRDYYKTHSQQLTAYPPVPSLVVGIDVDRDVRRERISRRLRQRLDDGMVEEVRGLLDSGIAPEDLIYYGLEYKYLTLYVTGRLTYDEMVSQLEIAIHQFAKRQMTWFRGMERRGTQIHWVRESIPNEEKVAQIKQLYEIFLCKNV
ncbi:MAG: tRNA (adenosine(37)-N6)-dimethylallyltransferase MiaA [Bacteroidales bacterium]|nr:tRNA (adenosine(37)-N6)-dimethylallyltransferase MiaA [Candidatus Liminaster caballi]